LSHTIIFFFFSAIFLYLNGEKLLTGEEERCRGGIDGFDPSFDNHLSMQATPPKGPPPHHTQPRMSSAATLINPSLNPSLNPSTSSSSSTRSRTTDAAELPPPAAVIAEVAFAVAASLEMLAWG
jgi:hypothetical protein